MEKLDEPRLREERRSVSVRRLAELYHARFTDQVDERFEVIHVLVGGIDRSNRVVSKPSHAATAVVGRLRAGGECEEYRGGSETSAACRESRQESSPSARRCRCGGCLRLRHRRRNRELAAPQCDEPDSQPFERRFPQDFPHTSFDAEELAGRARHDHL